MSTVTYIIAAEIEKVKQLVFVAYERDVFHKESEIQVVDSVGLNGNPAFTKGDIIRTSDGIRLFRDDAAIFVVDEDRIINAEVFSAIICDPATCFSGNDAPQKYSTMLGRLYRALRSIHIGNITRRDVSKHTNVDLSRMINEAINATVKF